MDEGGPPDDVASNCIVVLRAATSSFVPLVAFRRLLSPLVAPCRFASLHVASYQFVSVRVSLCRFVSLHICLCRFLSLSVASTSHPSLINSMPRARVAHDHAWLLVNLEKERVRFARETTFLPSRLDIFGQWDDLLEGRTAARGRTIRKQRMCARSLLVNVLSYFGLELTVLFTLSAGVGKLAQLDLNLLLPELSHWWSKESIPQSLSDYAATLRSTYASGSWISGAIADKARDDRRCIIQVQTSTSEKRRASIMEEGVDNLDTDIRRVSNRLGHANSATSGDSSRLREGPLLVASDEPVLNVQLRDLLSFLQLQNFANLPLRMNFTFAGTPLPSITIDEGSTAGLAGKLEFSIPLSEALLKYMLSLGAGPSEESDSRGS